MSQQIINNGDFLNDPSAETVYESFEKAKLNFAELYGFLGFKGFKEHFLSLTGIDTSESELTYIAKAIQRGKPNSSSPNGYSPYTCTDGQIMLFKTVVSTNNVVTIGANETVEVVTRYYRMHRGVNSIGGTGLPGGGPVIIGQIPLGNNEVSAAGQLTITPEENADLYIDLGDIALQNVWEVFNQGKPAPDEGDPWVIEGEKFITAIQNNEPKIWRFVGELGDWGGDDAQTNPNIFVSDAENFDLLSDNGQPTQEDFLIDILDLSTILNPLAGRLILDSEDLNNLKYFNGTDWVGIESGFKLATGQSGTIDDTKNVARSGKMSVGGDEPIRQFEVIGDFWNKETIDGIGTVVVVTGNDIASDAGIPSGILTGLEATFKDQVSGDRSAFFIGRGNTAGVSDMIAIFGINKGSNPLLPSEYARLSVFRAQGGIEHLVLDLECKNGANDSHKFRIRSGRFETNKPGILSAYGSGNLKEGETYDGGANIGVVTVGKPTHLLSVTTGGTVAEISVNKLGTEGYLVFDLPINAVLGDRAFVTNGNHNGVFGSEVNTTGTDTAPVFYDGTKWIYG